jgi:hypothetical protein
MYPTLVVALVAREMSVLEECASRARASGILMHTSIRFALPETSSRDRTSCMVHLTVPTDMGGSGGGGIATPEEARSEKEELQHIEA